MYPGNELNADLIISLINKAYWPIYGEMQILEEITMDRDKCLKEEEKCPTQSGTYYSYIALVVYMVIANVLLINLLIAMFSSTFQDVQVREKLYKKFQFKKLNFNLILRIIRIKFGNSNDIGWYLSTMMPRRFLHRYLLSDMPYRW